MKKRIYTRRIGDVWVAYPPDAHPLCYGVGITPEAAFEQLWSLFFKLLSKYEKRYSKVVVERRE